MNSARAFVLVFAGALSFAAPALAQTATPAPATTPAPAPSPVPPASAAPNDDGERLGSPIDTRTAVTRALAQNPSFYASQLGTAQAQQDVLIEDGRYQFVLGAGLGATHNGSPNGTQRTYDASVGLSRTFATGTSAELSVGAQRFENDSNFSGAGTVSTLPEGYGTSVRASVTQPLLRGAGKSVGELGLRTALQSRTLAEQSQKRAQSELVRDVLLAYWELWYADESVRIERSSLALAREQEQQAVDQRQQGALAPADVYTFQTRVASLEESLLMALAARDERSRELSRLMGVSADQAPELSAAERPEPGPLPTSQQVAAALRSGSLELAELETQARLARTRAEVAGDASRPRLDLEGYLQTQGQSARPGAAFSSAAELDWWTVHVGATFELPLGQTRHDAEKQSALLAVRIAETNLRTARDRLAADAVNSVAQARTAGQRVALSERTVAVAERAHEAARGRFELGGGIAIQVQQAEEDLRRARLSLARTRVELVQAEVAVRHLAGTLAGEFVKG